VVDGLRLLDEPQPQIVRGVPFSAVCVWENERWEEPIAMVGLTLGGVRVLHMGDCGHALGPDEVSACGCVDVLLALAGGPPTLAIEDLADFIEALAPRVVIPMHFGNNKINLNLRPVEDLLARVRGRYPVHALDTPTVTIRPDALPATTQVWVLPPAR
jgi:L-ascorbate metabolism protein UlaG (beta-lactamase superfamily)